MDGANERVQGICHKPRMKCQDCNHRQFTELNDQIIYRHLAGQQVVGFYPLMHDNTCYFLAADFDKGQWQEEVKAMSKACRKFAIPHANKSIRTYRLIPMIAFPKPGYFTRRRIWKFNRSTTSKGSAIVWQ